MSAEAGWPPRPWPEYRGKYRPKRPFAVGDRVVACKHAIHAGKEGVVVDMYISQMPLYPGREVLVQVDGGALVWSADGGWRPWDGPGGVTP